MDNTLQHLIYGKPFVGGQYLDESVVLAHSPHIEADVTPFRQRVALEPFEAEDVVASRALAWVAMQPDAIIGHERNRYVLARTQAQDGTTRYQYVDIPAEVILNTGGDLQPLLDLVSDPLPDYDDTPQSIDALHLPTTPTWAANKQLALLQTLYEILDADIEGILKLLGAAIRPQGLVIRGFPAELMPRLQCVQGLAMLLPSLLRPHLTFTTHTYHIPEKQPAIVFSESEGENPHNRYVVDWQTRQLPDDLLQQPYPAHLLTFWDGDLRAFVQQLRELEMLANKLTHGQTFEEGLDMVVSRHQYDAAVRTGDDVAIDDLLAVLQGDAPPTDTLYEQYMQHMLSLTLSERHKEAALYIAHAMDKDAELDALLDGELQTAMESQPDAVYVFVRSRLSEGLTDSWLQRLHDAATLSLEVAINSGDPGTLASWLRLIAREPTRYQLVDILREGVQAAANRAAEDGALARELIIIALKRTPDLLPGLLENAALMAALPESITQALRQFDSSAIEALADESRELFLLALFQAVDAEQTCITPAVIRALWEIYTRPNPPVIAEPYRPVNIIRLLSQEGTVSLGEGALETLLTLILAAKHDDLFYELASALAQRDLLLLRLVAVLEQAARPPDEVLQVMTHLINEQIITPQEAIDTFSMLLADANWSPESAPYVEQLSRLLNQNPDATTSMGVLWKLTEVAAGQRSEPMLRGAARRLLAEFTDTAVETQLIDNLERLRRSTVWSNITRGQVIAWWRDYARTQSLGQLQKIDRVLDGRKTLDDLRVIVQTYIAMRKMIGQRSMTEFAAAINTAYTILQAIAEGFDPKGGASKSAITIDTESIRNELGARNSEISPDEQQVLATNLKELAQIVTSLAENRSKSSLIRSDDTVERQLVSGEQRPQSAIDTMKWLSGFLDGSHGDDD